MVKITSNLDVSSVPSLYSALKAMQMAPIFCEMVA